MEMFNIKWQGDYSSYSVHFDDGWKRLNSCNAATHEKHNYSYDNALGIGILTDTYYLVSYATPIMIIKRVSTVQGTLIRTSIWINAYSWNISPTTKRQIKRFIDNINFFHQNIGCEYDDIVSRMNEHSIDDTDGTRLLISKRVCIYPISSYEIERRFEIQCPYFG